MTSKRRVIMLIFVIKCISKRFLLRMLHNTANTLDKGRSVELGTALSQAIWSIVYFPTKHGLKIDNFLTLVETNLIPYSLSWEMHSWFDPIHL